MRLLRQAGYGDRFQLLIVGLLFSGAIFVWAAVLQESRGAYLKVAFLDVGQGDAVFVKSPTGAQILIDGGPDKKVLRSMGKVMPFYDRTLDAVLATHPDTDHIGGLTEVLKRYNVNYIFVSGVNSGTHTFEEFEKAVAGEGAKIVETRRGLKIDLGGGAYLLTLFPDRNISLVDSNVGSIITKLVYGETSFLLSGDAPQATERYVASLDSELLKSHVIKAGHHGSRTSTSDLWLGLATPKYAVISVGGKNKYGHPHQETVDTLSRFGVKVLRTDLLGSVIFKSNGREVFVDKN